MSVSQVGNSSKCSGLQLVLNYKVTNSGQENIPKKILDEFWMNIILTFSKYLSMIPACTKREDIRTVYRYAYFVNWTKVMNLEIAKLLLLSSNFFIHIFSMRDAINYFTALSVLFYSHKSFI